jgi:hypothetical protein
MDAVKAGKVKVEAVKAGKVKGESGSCDRSEILWNES